MAQDTLMKVLNAEKIESFPKAPTLAAVARFEFFRHGARPAGVWLVRQGMLRFALPFTSGTKPSVADYLPAPHGLPGFAVPVEQVIPGGASFFEMPDGRILIATDGADEIVPGPDGRSVAARWRRFVVKGGKTGEWIEPGFEVEATWRIDGSTLTRTEALRATRDLTVRRLSWILPSTANYHPSFAKGVPAVIRLCGSEGALEIRTAGDLPVAPRIQKFGDEPLGRGARGAIPIHVEFDAKDIRLQAGRPRMWEISLTVSPLIKRTPR